MYRRILVPLDTSPFGEQALPMAMRLARQPGASLLLTHVHVPRFAGTEDVAGWADEQCREEERAYLNATVDRVSRNGVQQVNSAFLLGSVASAIGEQAQMAGTDLIVMTTHGRGPLSRLWLGSTADELIRRAPVPILLIRPQDKTPDWADEQNFRHILVPLDGSALAEQAIEPAVELGALMQAEFTLLRVIQPLVLGCDPQVTGAIADPTVLENLRVVHREQKTQARDYIERFAESLKARSLRVQARLVESEQPALAILEQAQQLGVDLIALASHGRGGLSRMLLGSVADKVLRGGSTAMLVYHPRHVTERRKA